MSFIIARRTAHGARRTAETFGKTAFAVIALIVGGFCTLTFADKTSAQQLPQTSISYTAKSGGFADFRKQQQARLLAAIDSTLATQAENAISENFAAVKKAEVQVQTGLGGRKDNIGINFIGSFDKADNRAFGWQLRGYAGQEQSTGLNAGVFYRKIDKGALFGANAFLDYENGDYGGFSRFGFGGEVQHVRANFAANYYLPLTDEQNVNSTLAAFSRQGFDAKLRINALDFAAVRLAMDYYNFDGKRSTKADDGLRYGVELTPIPALHLGVFYDDGAKRYGGNVVYAHTIGETKARKDAANFAPDMFAAVSREYSQRIVTVATTTAPPIRTIITPLLTITNAITAAAITTTTRMTAAEVRTTTTIETPTIMATRMASAFFTVRIDYPNLYAVVTTTIKHLVTLPSIPEVVRPIVITTTRNLDVNNQLEGRVIETDTPPLLRQRFDIFPDEVRTYTLTIVEGSEEFISVTTTLTTRTTTTMAGAITETPMTMAAISTTTRITTFSTMFITLTANAAMDDIPPLDSRFRPKGGSYEMAALERRGNDKQPSFPRKRESKPLSFVHLRDSANGDLSPQMANRRVRKA
ncbi:MAG: inverse autotransporter beta domain-containing protein, partial [Gammaproteobacteria bacterium]